MKKLLYILLIPVLSTAQGVDFQDMDFSQLLSKAKKENKILFIDAYAEWCGPCKSMTKNVFPDSSVGEFYNVNFINATMDMENDDESNIAFDYDVTTYPTLLFIDGNGKLLHKAVGFHTPEELIDLGKEALNPKTQLYTQIDYFDTGDIDPESLYNVALRLLKNYDTEATGFARAYYETQEDLLTYKSIDLMYETIDSPESFEFQFLLQNEEEAEKIYQDNSISERLDEIALEYAIDLNLLGQPEKIKIEKLVLAVEKTIFSFRPKNAKDLANYCGMMISQSERNHKLFEKYALAYLDSTYKSKSPEILNDIAWYFYEYSKNKKSLEKALLWAINSVAKLSTPYNNDTVAHLYRKLGDKEKARVYIETAINLGKEDGIDTSVMEAFMLELK